MPNVPLEDAQNCPCKQDCSCNAKSSYCCCDKGNPGNPICGCTDSSARNYNPRATKSDNTGRCKCICPRGDPSPECY